MEFAAKMEHLTENSYLCLHLTNVLTDHLNILTQIKAWLLPINKIKTTTSVLYYDLENLFWKIFSKL